MLRPALRHVIGVIGYHVHMILSPELVQLFLNLQRGHWIELVITFGKTKQESVVGKIQPMHP